MVLLIVFVVAMLLWVVSLWPEVPAPAARVGGICAWIAVLSLFLMGHAVRI